jgi:hypothetical protein
MWGLEIPDGVHKLLGQRPRKYAEVFSSLKKAFQKRNQPKGQIKKLEWDGVPTWDFIVIKIMPEEAVKEIRTPQLEGAQKDFNRQS